MMKTLISLDHEDKMYNTYNNYKAIEQNDSKLHFYDTWLKS